MYYKINVILQGILWILVLLVIIIMQKYISSEFYNWECQNG